MLFNSSIFLFFFLPVVIGGNLLLKRVNWLQKVWLLGAGLLFYGWGNPEWLIFLIIFGVINYLIGMWIHTASQVILKKVLLAFGVVLNVCCLLVIKYPNYLSSFCSVLLRKKLYVENSTFVPLGISFLVFSVISYMVDIFYHKDSAVLTSFLDYCLYISFFPKVSQGPIVAASQMKEDFVTRSITVETFSNGLRRFICGLGKKVLIADILGKSVDMVYSELGNGISAGTALLTAICYTLQIFYDFSGYTDMAIGVAKMLGFHLPENFNNPYFSLSVSDFWRRWHITLGTWFRNYVYIPLGGNRKGSVRTTINLMIVWLLTGIWHGATDAFLIWGLYHGILIVAEKQISGKPAYKKAPRFIKWLITLLLVMIGWVFFRSGTLSCSITFFRTMLGLRTDANVIYGTGYYYDSISILALTIGVLLLGNPYLVKKIKKSTSVWLFVENLLLTFILLLSIVFFASSTYRSFIYFQF